MAVASFSGDGRLNGATEVVIVPAPGAGATRISRTITLYNRDTVAHTLTLQYANGVDRRTLWSGSMAAGESLTWNDPLILDATDKSIVAASDAPATVGEPDYTAHYIEQTAGAGGGGASAIGDLSDVDTATVAPATEDRLWFNGTAWVPRGELLAAGELSTGSTINSSAIGRIGANEISFTLAEDTTVLITAVCYVDWTSGTPDIGLTLTDDNWATEYDLDPYAASPPAWVQAATKVRIASDLPTYFVYFGPMAVVDLTAGTWQATIRALDADSWILGSNGSLIMAQRL